MIVLAYAIMSNHFHIYIYVPESEELDDGEILRRINALYRESSLSQVLGKWKRLVAQPRQSREVLHPHRLYP